MKNVASVAMVNLILIATFALAFSIQPIKAAGTIYIRADGSVDPPTSNITTADSVTYTFTNNNYGSIVVERNNIVIDGAGFTLQGPGGINDNSFGFYWPSINNVTIKHTNIISFAYAIVVDTTSKNVISGNNITVSDWGTGIALGSSSNNSISGNNITNNHFHNTFGITLGYSSNNSIAGNSITGNDDGILAAGSNYDSISGNNITGNWNRGIVMVSANHNNISGNNIAENNAYAIYLVECSNNKIFHNNFINNANQVYSENSVNIWDDEYPSGGNYWSDYTGIDVKYGPDQDNLGSDGIGDQPYTIDVNNLDRYPLMKPFPWAQHDVGITRLDVSKTVVGQGYDVVIRPMLFNYGESIELVELHIQVDSKVFQYALVLSGRGSTYLVLTLHTNEFAMGNYTILAYVEPVPGETDVTDNTLDRWVFITLAGDVDGDRDVDIFDIVLMAGTYGDYIPPVWPLPPYDIDGDGDVDIFDLVAAAGNYGKSW